MRLPVEKEKAIDHFVRIIRSCGDSREAAAAKRVHRMIKQNPELQNDRYLANLLVQMYGKCGLVEEAQQVFDSTTLKNAFTWTMLLSAYANNWHLDKAKLVFDQTPHRDTVTWNTIIKAYAQARLIPAAGSIFWRMPQWDEVTRTTLVVASAQQGDLQLARTVFDLSEERDVVSWTAMLTAYSGVNRIAEAKHMFDQMPRRTIVTWNAIIAAFARGGAEWGWLLRAAFDRMPHRNIVGCTIFLEACGRLEEAEDVFLQMPERNLISCTAMLLAYARGGRISSAERLFFDVVMCKPELRGDDDVVIWTAMVMAYWENGCLAESKSLFDEMPQRNILSWHAILQAFSEHQLVSASQLVFNKMPAHDVIAWNIVCGAHNAVSDLRRVFDQMPERNLHSWNEMMSAYSRSISPEESVRIFDACPAHDVISLTALLLALGHAGQVARAEAIFRTISGQLDTVSWNAMIVVLVSNGHLAKARGIFSRMMREGRTTAVSWNAMVSAHAQNGHADVARHVVREMCLAGGIPGPESFRCLLVACSYSGSVEQGWHDFVDMQSEHGVEAGKDHYCCMVDLLGRAGRLSSAEELINSMPFLPTEVEWGSLLGACSLYDDLPRAQRVADIVLTLVPIDSSSSSSAPYVTLSNVNVFSTQEHSRVCK